MNNNRPLVSIVDDDESVRESLPDLLTGIRIFDSGVLVGGRVSRFGVHWWDPVPDPRHRDARHDRA